MPGVAFHVSSSLNRESIREHGLDWRRMLDQRGLAGSEVEEGPYVFLAQDVEEVEWFVEISRTHHASVDIWEVALAEDVAMRDGETAPPPPYREVDGFLCTTEPIPPERLRLIKTSTR